MIQLQATSSKPLWQITESCRRTVSRICGGLDAIDRLGHKALVFRAEIHPANISHLAKALTEDGVKILDNSLPSASYCNDNDIHLLTLQVVTSASNTDQTIEIARVPG